MVLHKRRPVVFDAPKTFAPDAEVWLLECTGEVFGSYEDYLKKYDYYSQVRDPFFLLQGLLHGLFSPDPTLHQKIFTCGITGHTNLTFQEAWKSETSGSREIDSTFPEQLREPILRKVQFSTISRIDDLVTHLYETFKGDFFPGEQVNVQREETGEKFHGTIRDKTTFPELQGSDGSIQRRSRATYNVEIDDSSGSQQPANDTEITRERRAFSKQNLRPFLKNTIYRERWEGAPWLVKEAIAKKYNINNAIPTNLQYENVMAERKEAAAVKRGAKAAEKQAKLEPRPEKRTKKNKDSQEVIVNGHKRPKHSAEANGSKSTNEDAAPDLQPIVVPIVSGIFELDLSSQSIKDEPGVSAPSSIKFPVEDLALKPREEKLQRPPLSFLSSPNVTKGSPDSLDARRDIVMDSVGSLLEIWNTLNVHTELLILDSFTFDDFVDAMLFSSHDLDCELFDEVHCAILKTLTDENGDPDNSVPVLPDEEDDDDDDEEDDEEGDGEDDGEGNEANASSVENSMQSTLKSDLGKSRRTSARLAMARPKSPEDTEIVTNGFTNGHEPPEAPVEHCAEEVLGEYHWSNRIHDQDFKEGGWQVIMVGLLHHMSLAGKRKPLCDRILSRLAPVNGKATREAVRRNYIDLDINSRISALEVATMLAISTKSFKDFMDRRSLEMTTDRKKKQDWQKHKKVLFDELRALDEERKILRPVSTTEDPNASMSNGNGATLGTEAEDETMAEADTTSEEEAPTKGPGKRTRVSDRAYELKRKRELEDIRKEKEKKARLEEAKIEKEQAGYRKVLRDIDSKHTEIKDCEREIDSLEERLREIACHRTKVLGRDRFMNRYYWFERNGMRFGGSQESSTASHGYANGRLWVQGPDDLERDGFLDLNEESQRRYREGCGMSTHERRSIEEGPTSLENAMEWGYYDNSESLDQLIGWLDDRGERERALAKELQTWKGKISECMSHLKQHYTDFAEKRAKLEEPIVGIATRKKTFVDLNSTRFPCLAWTNSMAKRELGRLHSEGKPPKRTKGSIRGKSKMLPAVPDTPTTTRRGTRYRG